MTRLPDVPPEGLWGDPRAALGGVPRELPRDVACRELVELLTDYLEGVLPASEVEAIEAHLLDCEGCQNYLDQMRTTISVLGSVPVQSLSQEAIDVLLAAFAASTSPPGPRSAG